MSILWAALLIATAQCCNVELTKAANDYVYHQNQNIPIFIQASNCKSGLDVSAFLSHCKLSVSDSHGANYAVKMYKAPIKKEHFEIYRVADWVPPADIEGMLSVQLQDSTDMSLSIVFLDVQRPEVKTSTTVEEAKTKSRNDQPSKPTVVSSPALTDHDDESFDSGAGSKSLNAAVVALVFLLFV